MRPQPANPYRVHLAACRLCGGADDVRVCPHCQGSICARCYKRGYRQRRKQLLAEQMQQDWLGIDMPADEHFLLLPFELLKLGLTKTFGYLFTRARVRRVIDQRGVPCATDCPAMPKLPG